MGVHFVCLAIQLQHHLVSGVFDGVPGFKGDLCGSAPEVHGPQRLLLGLDPFPEPPTLSKEDKSGDVMSCRTAWPPQPSLLGAMIPCPP